jgi:hypothetical protein
MIGCAAIVQPDQFRALSIHTYVIPVLVHFKFELVKLVVCLTQLVQRVSLSLQMVQVQMIASVQTAPRASFPVLKILPFVRLAARHHINPLSDKLLAQISQRVWRGLLFRRLGQLRVIASVHLAIWAPRGKTRLINSHARHAT